MMARLQMKFVFVFNALLYISLLSCLGGKQGMCANLGMPINVNVGNCEGVAKGVSAANPGMPININVGDRADAVKPSAHLEASKGDATYGNNHVIQDWSVNAPNSHIAGGMTYKDGKLTVPTPGRYYIYAQFYYHHTGRIYLRVNNNIITMLQPPAPYRSGLHGALYTGGVFQLKADDVITLLATNIHGNVRGHMNPFHSYFGAFLI